MAFVFRSPKDLLNNIETNDNQSHSIKLFNELYNKSKKPILKNIKTQPNIPFGSTAIKASESLINKSVSPGPAAYYLKNNLIKKKFNENDTSPFDDNKKLFISQEKRFNEKINDNPGPGNYYKDKIKKENSFSFLEYSHNLKSGNFFEFNTSNRVVTIPSIDNKIIVTQNKMGEYKILENKKKNKNCNDNNNLGPGSYDIKLPLSKKNKILDWSKSLNSKNSKEEKINDLNKGIIRSYSEMHENNNYWDENNENIKNQNNENIKNIFEDEIERKRRLNDFYALQEKMIKEQIKNAEKKEITPGPGEYNVINSFGSNKKNSRCRNFGSNKARGLLCNSQEHNNNLIINKNLSTNFLSTDISDLLNSISENSNKNIKESQINKTKKINLSAIANDNNIKPKKLLISILPKIKIKNEKSEDKNYELSNIGPGSYDPILLSEIRKNNNDFIQNFGTLEKRFNNNLNENPGVGSFNLINSWKPNKKIFKSCIPKNILKKNIEGISANSINNYKIKLYIDKHTSPSVGQYSPENNDSIEYKSKKLLIDSNKIKKPGFIFGEKRFLDFKKKFEDENQVGKYELGPKEIKIEQKSAPFSSNVEKYKKIIDDSNYNANIGPGSYRYDSFFDWNTKSQNILFA